MRSRSRTNVTSSAPRAVVDTVSSQALMRSGGSSLASSTSSARARTSAISSAAGRCRDDSASASAARCCWKSSQAAQNSTVALLAAPVRSSCAWSSSRCCRSRSGAMACTASARRSNGALRSATCRATNRAIVSSESRLRTAAISRWSSHCCVSSSSSSGDSRSTADAMLCSTVSSRWGSDWSTRSTIWRRIRSSVVASCTTNLQERAETTTSVASWPTSGSGLVLTVPFIGTAHAVGPVHFRAVSHFSRSRASAPRADLSAVAPL